MATRRFPVHDLRGGPTNGEALRVRLTRIRGLTPKHILAAPFGLPAVVNDFQYDEEANHVEYDTVNSGEFSQPLGGLGFHGRKLKRLDCESLAMECDAPWLAHSGYSLEDVKGTLEEILRSKRPFQLDARVYSGNAAPYEIRMQATLRKITPVLRQGQRSIRYWSLSFTEWRDASVGRRTSNPGRGGPFILPTKHKLTASDTLQSLSMHFYGTYGLARQLGARNGLSKWGLKTPIVNSKRWKIGQGFLIPPLDARWEQLPGPRLKDQFVSG